MDVPAIPLMPDGTLPPTMLLLRWLGSQAATSARLDALPPGNHILPDVLRLGGIAELQVSAGAAPPCRWEGSGGGRVLLRPDGVPPQDDAPLHCGALPATASCGTADAGTLALCELARLEDASAAVGCGDGAIWDHLLARSGRTGGMPPGAAARSGRGGEGLGAWNPLPLARPCLVALEPSSVRAPWAVRDDGGALHPVQAAEGVLGPTWLVQLPLGPLGGTTLRPEDEPAPGAHWEVSPRLLDNGRVRAELDDLGQIVRLCWDGVFADLAGPACSAVIDGLPLAGPAEIAVLEDGPVRARLAVRRETPAGRLDLVYTLHAYEDALRIHASWSGTATCWCDHATAQRSALLHLAGEGARWSRPQAASAVDAAMPWTGGVRWASLADAAGRGLAVAAGRPLTLRACGGHLRIRVDGGGVAWALAAPRRASDTLSLGALAEHLAVPGRSLPAGTAVPRPFRLADQGSLVPLWAARPAGWDGELLLAEQAGARSRAWLLPGGALRTESACGKVDACGRMLAACPPSPEGDGWRIDAAPGELILVRWRR